MSTNLLARLTRPRTPQRFSDPWGQWWSSFMFQGTSYPFGMRTTLAGTTDEEPIGNDFTAYVTQIYQQNGVVFAVMLVRLLLFAEARFQFRRFTDGRPGELFGSGALGLLEKPWRNGTTGDLLARAIQDVDLAGNFYATRRPGLDGSDRLTRLRPDWTTIVLGGDSADDIDAEVVGYIYHPGGLYSGVQPTTLLARDTIHFAPIPDPLAVRRGMSWITPVLREIGADLAASNHKQAFFKSGATPNMIIKFDPATGEDAFNTWVKLFRENHEGAANAYKTLFLGGGADATVVGSNMQEIDFKKTTGQGESRIAAAGGVPPVIVGLSEGLEASTYSNYTQARRRLTDGTMRPLWRNFAASASAVIEVPAGAELWYDDRDIPFLSEDEKDRADIASKEAQTIRQLVDAGYDADSVVAAVMSHDWHLLKHSGLFSVQLQPPTTATTPPAPPEPGDTNGTAP